MTLFDNAARIAGTDAVSRALRLRVDTFIRTVTLIRAYPHPDGLAGISQGNVQELPNGILFVGWGHSPYLSEFTPDGTLVFHATIGAESDTYRAYRQPWTGRPATAPTIVVSAADPARMTVAMSWNGATEVVSWDTNGVSVPRTGFETTNTIPRAVPLTVKARDRRGVTLTTTSVPGI